MIKSILQLGNPKLYVTCTEYSIENIPQIQVVATNLSDTLAEYRRVYGAGRAIAAPQIGIQKRLLYVEADEPIIMINPVLTFDSDEKMMVYDDCMSFPGLIVQVERYCKCNVTYFDMDWKKQSIDLEGDLAELIQHEYDHLDGILSTMRAIDDKAFYMGNINDYR